MSSNLDESDLLIKFQQFFKEKIINNHLRNTKKLKKLKEFKINLFTWRYLAKFFTGNDSARSLAQVLVCLPKNSWNINYHYFWYTDAKIYY